MTNPILHIEDNPHDAETTEIALNRAFGPVSLILASEGQEGLQILGECAACEREQVSLVLLDLKLTGIDGFDILPAILALPMAPPVVILSSSNAPERRLRAAELGVAAYICKPFGFAELVADLKNTLEPYSHLFKL